MSSSKYHEISGFFCLFVSVIIRDIAGEYTTFSLLLFYFLFHM